MSSSANTHADVEIGASTRPSQRVDETTGSGGAAGGVYEGGSSTAQEAPAQGEQLPLWSETPWNYSQGQQPQQQERPQAQQQERREQAEPARRESIEEVRQKAAAMLDPFAPKPEPKAEPESKPEPKAEPQAGQQPPAQQPQPQDATAEAVREVVPISANDLDLAQETTRSNHFTPEQMNQARKDDERRRAELKRKRDAERKAREEAGEPEPEPEKKPETTWEDRQRQRDGYRAQLVESAGGNVSRSKPSIFSRATGAFYRNMVNSPLPHVTDDQRVNRPSNVVKTLRDKISSKFGGNGTGTRIYGKMVPLPSLKLREVGIGLEEFYAIIDQNPDTLDALIKKSVKGEVLDKAGFVTCRTMLPGEVMDLINDNDVFVFTAKAPNNRGQDVQRRQLKVLDGCSRGIYLHPAMAAMYTADFDGDDMLVSLDPSLAENAKDPMRHLIGIDGAQSLDMSFLYVSELHGKYRDGRTKSEYVRDVILERWSRMRKNAGEFDDLVDSIVALSETALQGEDERAKAYGDVFRAARKYSDAMTNSELASDRWMSDIVNAVFEGMRFLGTVHALNTIGEVRPMDGMERPKLPCDEAIMRVVDGMVTGVMPNNFQELKILMNGFLGNAAGKNAAFRFTADVGKMMKFDDRFKVGDGSYEFKQDDDAAMAEVLQKTVKYAYSQKMSVDVKKAGKSLYLNDLLRRKVIGEVGFPDEYKSMRHFLVKFSRVYNKYAAMINEANIVWESSMAISSRAERPSVQYINTTWKQSHGKVVKSLPYSSIATPFIDVYGTYGFDRMLGQHIKYRETDDRNNAGGEADFRITRSRTWIKARYANMSVRAFSVMNEIRLGSDRKKMDDNVLEAEDNREAVSGLIAAIADKRTSTASSFAGKVIGKYQSKDGKRSNISTAQKNGNKTAVAMMMEPLKDIRNADLEGTLLAPGYYAGIGSRETPDEVQKAMIHLAKRLDASGFRLRSGHAKGADSAFEIGAGENADIYLADQEVGKKTPHAGGRLLAFGAVSEEDRAAANESVTRYHPVPDRLRKSDGDDYVWNLQARNYFQVAGTNGEQDSAFVVCWNGTTYDKESGNPRPWGGTDQAVRMAKDRGVPVFDAADYDDLEQWENDVMEAANKCLAGQLYRTSTADQMLHVDDAIMTLNAIDYDMFRALGMDSTAGFLHSEYGRKMVEYADNPDMLASIWAAMVFKYQTMDLTNLSAELRELNEQNDAGEAGVYKYQSLMERAWFMMDELAAKSQVWKGLMAEIRTPPGHDKAFESLQGNTQGKFWKASDFWSANGENAHLRERYSSIRDVIEDLDLEWPLKCDIITDVVRWQVQDYHIDGYEVPYGLRLGGDSRFSLYAGNKRASLSAYDDMKGAYNRYSDLSLRKLRNEVMQARRLYRDRPGSLKGTIRTLASQPWLMVNVDDGLYADAVLAVRDKLYAQTEKAKKHPWTNALYAALSFQRNGGFFNDVYRFDNRVLGLQHMSDVSPRDIVRILDDPSYMISVYDDYGSIGHLSQATLLGITDGHEATEEEIWDWMIENPRIACVIRTSTACVSADSKGDGYLGTTRSISQTIEDCTESTNGTYYPRSHDTLGHVKYLMRDHPVYGGLISMLTPAHATSARTDRSRVMVVEDVVCKALYNASRNSGETGASRLLADLGITRAKLRSLLTSDFDKYMAKMGHNWDVASISEAKDEANDIYDVLESHVAKYIDEIRREVPYGRLYETQHEVDAKKINKVKGEEVLRGIDVESVASFWDTVQELSGAKVGVSTGVEGSETYQLSYWVSRMGAKDHYASLDYIEDLIRENPDLFDGAWTSKGPLVVGEDGTIDIESVKAQKRWDGEEVTVKVPDGVTVPDRSTDTNEKRQVPSLYAAMVSKRSNGAEKFNLKAMKAGLDGTDSVTKMDGKYHVRHYSDGSTMQELYLLVSSELSQISQEEGIEAARMNLAKRMMDTDNKMGYDDMSISNYMCLAEMMLVEDGEGGIILRSLEQLAQGVRGRIGAQVDEMTDKQTYEAVQSIVNDASESAIGRSMVYSAQELLATVRPKRMNNGSTAGVKMTSSVTSRNWSLISAIQEKTGVVPSTPKVRDEYHERFLSENGYISDLFNGCELMRDYRVAGYVGGALPDGEKDPADMTPEENWHDDMGPSVAYVIGMYATADRVHDICAKAYERGASVIIDHRANMSKISNLLADMVPLNEQGDMLIPMFDMRLNGFEGSPHRPSFSIFQVPFSRYVISVEDALNVFNLGDAQYKFTRALTSRIKARDHDTVELTALSLFQNVFKNERYKNATFSVSLANMDVVNDFILNPASPTCTIDYGIVEGASGEEQRIHDVLEAIARYKTQIDMSDGDDCVLRGVDVQPGDIIGWADLTISMDGEVDHHVLAPLIPFPLHHGKRVADTFQVGDVGPVNNDGSLFGIDWGFERDIEGFVKYFDSSGGANKGMIDLSNVIEEALTLENGILVDAFCAAASTDSRKIGTDRRIKTMITLMVMARMGGYNFARTPGAFPDNPEIDDGNGGTINVRDALLKGRIPMSFWDRLYKGDEKVRFHENQEINDFIDYECRKIYENQGSDQNGGNPSDFLACEFEDEDGNRWNSHVMWEFECMFNGSLRYEDMLLRFLNMMDSKLCPNGLDDPTESTLFRLHRDESGDLNSGYDTGVLQMKVPYLIPNPPGSASPYKSDQVSYVWSVVAAGMSFFGEDYAGFTRPNIRGGSDMMDAENTGQYYNIGPRGHRALMQAAWSTAGYARGGTNTWELTDEH